MSDSFFTARNPYDIQFDEGDLRPAVCEQILEAAARRIAKISGPLAAAARIQRVADICAGAHVLPIEHWKQLGESLPKPPPTKTSRLELERAWAAVVANPWLVFWVGVGVGLWMGSR